MNTLKVENVVPSQDIGRCSVCQSVLATRVLSIDRTCEVRFCENCFHRLRNVVAGSETPCAKHGKSALETKWSVRDIQRAVVSYTRNYNSIPNVAWGFFGRMECDLVQLTDADRIHEFEIKRSWSDFMADFKKTRFHDDIRICRLTFVIPESFAGDRLKKFCADHYAEFKREFDFMFYSEGDECKIVRGTWETTDDWRSQYVLPEPFRTDTYITTEMLKTIRKNDVAAPYRRRLFTEELAKLYRLGVIRLWHWPQEEGEHDEKAEVAEVTENTESLESPENSENAENAGPAAGDKHCGGA